MYYMALTPYIFIVELICAWKLNAYFLAGEKQHVTLITIIIGRHSKLSVPKQIVANSFCFKQNLLDMIELRILLALFWQYHYKQALENCRLWL